VKVNNDRAGPLWWDGCALGIVLLALLLFGAGFLLSRWLR
jgi:hypothetical protein